MTTIAEDPLENFARGVRKDTENKWDVVSAFTGPEGVGKSSCMITVASYIDKAFDLEKNISFMPKHSEVIEKFNALNQGQVYVIDEAIKVLDKQDWANNLQRSIRQMYATERKQRKVTFLGMPRFIDLAERFRNHRVRYWFRVISRGICTVHVIDDEPDLGYYDPWHIKDNIKIKQLAYGRRNVVDRDVETILNAERKLPTFWFDFKFDALPKDIEKKYDELVAKYKAIAEKEDTEEEIMNKKEKWLANLVASVNMGFNCPKCKTLYQPSITDIAHMCGNTDKGLPPPDEKTLQRYVAKEFNVSPYVLKHTFKAQNVASAND